MKTCVIEHCDKRFIARGWCSKHYKRGQIYGDPNTLLIPQEFHGMSTSPEYRVWTHILGRCNNPNDVRYADYGGRGIKVGFNSFTEFFKEVGKRPSPELTIDRIDNDKGYEPGNLRWATTETQNRNKRVYRTSRTGLKGIRPTKSGKWNVRICVGNGKQKTLGTFPTIAEARKELLNV